MIDLNDVITFQGTCVDELRQAMADSVDDYLEFCAELGREPEKPFSGNTVLFKIVSTVNSSFGIVRVFVPLK